MIMTKQRLENIKKYSEFLDECILIDYVQNIEEEYDKNIEFFGSQINKIHYVLIDTLEEYSVDWESFVEGVYYVDERAVLINAVEACLDGFIGYPKIYVKNPTNYKLMLNILYKIEKEIPIQIDSFDQTIYIEGKTAHITLIKNAMSKHPICKKLKISSTYDYPNETLRIDTRDYITQEEYVKRCFDE